MLNFNDAVSDILGGLTEPTIIVQIAPTNQRFEEFKQWAVGYVQEHDSLEPHHQTLQQIPSMASADDLEQLLRHNHEYCNDCLLKMYRKYAIEEEEVEEVGCGAPAEEEQGMEEDPFTKAGAACAGLVDNEEEPPVGGS